MKKGISYKRLLLILVLLFPLFVFADSEKSVGEAFITEIAVSLHMTLFVLWPLAILISKEKEDIIKKIIILFVSRAIILVILTPFLPEICYVDVFLLFAGAFTVAPIGFGKMSKFKSSGILSSSSVINGVSTSSFNPTKIICPKCGYEMAYGNKTCVKCGYDFSALYSGNVSISEATKCTCTKCGKEAKPGNKFCAFCGGSVESVANIGEIKVINGTNESISYGTPLDKNGFNLALFESTQDKTLLKIINDSISKNPDAKGKTLASIESRKVIMTLVYSISLSLMIMLYAAYHTNLLVIIVAAILLTIIFFSITKNYSVNKYLMKEIKSRPDEKIDYVVSSTLSGSINNGVGFKCIRIIIFALFLGVSVLLFSKPHYIYEKDADGRGYFLRYYTLGLLENEKNISIPSTYNGEEVVGIRGDVFKNMYYIQTVELPDTIVEIRGGAFQNCYSLKSINLPPKITEIHGSTFENCYSLESIVIPEGVTRIGGSAFRECNSLASVTIPSTVNEIGSSAFRNTRISSVCISRNTYVNERAFKDTYPSIYYYENNCSDSGDYNYGGYNN